MTEEEKIAKRKAAQAKAHAKWRASPKGLAYAHKLKLKRAGVDVVEIEDGEVTVK
jgi:hypothetical protein